MGIQNWESPLKAEHISEHVLKLLKRNWLAGRAKLKIRKLKRTADAGLSLRRWEGLMLSSEKRYLNHCGSREGKKVSADARAFGHVVGHCSVLIKMSSFAL